MSRLFFYPNLNLIILCFFAPLAATSATVVNSPSQAAVNAAIACPLISYRESFSGGAYTNGAWFGGASIVLAVASHAGNTTADARLLAQIRHTLTAGNEPCANGGYPAQHERHVTGMFAIVKQTPQIWNQLTTAEKAKIDLVMKATFIASAFVTSDTNPYVTAGTQQYALDGDYNLNRDWNPNYREGMLGGVLVGMVYFGGPVAAEALLNNYNHTQFVAELNANGLPNAYRVFNWKAANPGLSAPTGLQIQDAVKNYKFYSSALSNYISIYNSLVNDTYGKNVNSGLNGGAGIGGSGKIASGAATLPNLGAVGMLKEFDTIDAGGYRSSMVYAYDGFRPHQTNQLVMIIGGFWDKGSTTAANASARMKIGNTDLWYKLEKGYYDYSKGAARGLIGADFIADHGFEYVRSLWEDVLLPYHESISDSDGDGTDDATELRLGLNPNNSSSRFAVSLTAGVLRWPSVTGVNFTVQRSISRSAVSWHPLVTVAGTAGTATFTDPSPPAAGALYRIGLNP